MKQKREYWGWKGLSRDEEEEEEVGGQRTGVKGVRRVARVN